jgi:hypothetical protein
MKLETKFDIGDTVYAAYSGRTATPLTIGQVRKSITNSPGREGEEMFDNYKPQTGDVEEYMCVQTGIGTGSVYLLERVFATPEEAQYRLNEILNAQSDS